MQPNFRRHGIIVQENPNHGFIIKVIITHGGCRPNNDLFCIFKLKNGEANVFFTAFSTDLFIQQAEKRLSKFFSIFVPWYF